MEKNTRKKNLSQTPIFFEKKDKLNDMQTVHFVLLIISLFLLAAIILAICIDTSQRSVNQFDTHIDIVLIETGRKRLESLYRLWKARWHSRYDTRFIVFVMDQSDVHPFDSNVLVLQTPVPSSSTPLEHQINLFTHMKDYVGTWLGGVSGRSFLWAGDNVFPLQHRVKPSVFQVPNSHMFRFFNGTRTDGFLIQAEEDFESTLPCTPFVYDEIDHRDFNDIKLQLMLPYEPKYVFSAQIEETVVLKTSNDLDRLQHRTKSAQPFEVIHISPRSADQAGLNEKVQLFLEMELQH